LRQLGFPVAVLADSDQPLDPTADQLAAEGVEVVVWDDEIATEARLSRDLPWDCFERLVDVAVQARSIESVRSSVFAKLEAKEPSTTTLAEWLEAGIGEQDLRTAFAAAAAGKNAGWFKRVDLGEVVGGIVADCWDRLEGTDLRTKLDEICAWVYADDWT